jgi:hypothetical protein
MASLVFLNSTSKAWTCDFGVLAPGVKLGWSISFNTSSWIISSIGFVPSLPGVEVVYSTTSIKSDGQTGDPDHPLVDRLTYFGTLQINYSAPVEVRAVGVLTSM